VSFHGGAMDFIRDALPLVFGTVALVDAVSLFGSALVLLRLAAVSFHFALPMFLLMSLPVPFLLFVLPFIRAAHRRRKQQQDPRRDEDR